MVEKKTKTKAKKRGRPAKKKAVKKEVTVAKQVKKPVVKRTHLFAVGRRKCAVARVRFNKVGEPLILINNKDYKEFFPVPDYRKIVEKPLELVNQLNKHNITIKVQGGGLRSQAISCQLGIARIIAAAEPELRKILKKEKLLRRDARVKERKKYGLKRARRAPQWAKR